MSTTKAIMLGKRNDCSYLLPLSPLVMGTSDMHGDLPWVQLALIRKIKEWAEVAFFWFRQARQPLQ